MELANLTVLGEYEVGSATNLVLTNNDNAPSPENAPTSKK